MPSSMTETDPTMSIDLRRNGQLLEHSLVERSIATEGASNATQDN